MHHFKAIATTAALTAALTLPSLPAAAQETVLRYSSWFPPQHSINTALAEWISNVETATEGRVTVEYLPATAGTPRDQFDVAVDGLADITLVLPGYTPGRFPLLEMGELPMLVETDQATLAPAFNRVYDQHLAQYQPFRGTHVLTVFASAPTHVVTVPNRPVESMADFGGLKLRSPSAIASQVIEAVGAVTVQRPVTEIYELATTGVVDGTFFSLGPIISWRTQDAFKNITVMPGGMGQSVIALLINEDRWNAIPEADRDAIMEVSGPALAALIGGVWQEDEDRAEVQLEEIGGFNFHEASDAFFAEFKDAVAPVEAAWIDRAREAGIEDPAALLEALRAELAAAGGTR
jgi:TRAP-type transport system periplasmic protein